MYLNNTKVSENEICNLPYEFDNIESSCLNSMTKHQEYQSFIIWNHYSSFNELVKQRVALMKFNEIRLLKQQNKNNENCRKRQSVENLNKGEFEIYREAQLEYFATQFDNLLNNEPITNKSKILLFTLIFVENLIRVGGRVQKSDIPYYCKHQIILCKSHPLSKLIILDKHHSSFHTGRDQTLAILREKAWASNSKYLIRSVLRKCRFCKRMNTKPKPPLMGELPRQRLYIGLPAFTNTGIDYFWRLTLMLNKLSKQGKPVQLQKRYEAVLTCLISQAVHLELIGNLSTDHFILELWRYISRRVYAVEIFSDNGTNFIGRERELCQAIS